MEVIKEVSQFFLLVVALGTNLFQFLVNSKMTGAGFIRLLAGVCGGATALSLIISLTMKSSLLLNGSISLALISFILTYIFHQDERSSGMWLLFLVQTLALGISGFILLKQQMYPFLFFLSSALLFGIVDYAMILGHYYLVVPKLSEKPLIVSMKLTWIFCILKVVASTIDTFKHSQFFAEFTELGAGYTFNWIMLTMRYLWGYIIVFILSIFAYKLSKIRSTQSATGVMYVMVFFAIVGELISIYLFYNYGLYI